VRVWIEKMFSRHSFATYTPSPIIIIIIIIIVIMLV